MTLEKLNRILELAIISDPLQEAVKETILAIEKGDIELAVELTAVKSLICGKGADPEIYHFRENTLQNKAFFGRSVYSFLDSIHHNLAFKLGKMPSGMMILTGDGILERPESVRNHPIVNRIREERETIRRRARMAIEGVEE